MQFLNPLALLLTPLVAVLLWLNSRRARSRQSVANLYMWQRAASQVSPGLRRRRLWRNWLLAVQAAFVLAAIAALARPTLTINSSPAVFILDISGSMTATTGSGGTRLDAAKQLAIDRLARLAANRVRIISAGAAAADRGLFSRSSAADAIRGENATAGSAVISDALQLARSLDGPGAEIYVFSDLSAPDRSADSHMQWVHVGDASDNVGISNLSARPDPIDSTLVEVVVAVRNASEMARDLELELAAGDSLRRTSRVHAEARSTETILDRVPAFRGVLTARIAPRDALHLDDQRLTVAPDSERLRVLLRSNGNSFLEKALTSNAALSVDIHSDAAALASRDYDVIVCDQCVDVPPGHGGVLLWRPPSTADAAAPAPLVVSESAHPVARAVSLAGVFGFATAGPRPTSADTIVRAGTTPVVIASEEHGRRIVDIRVGLTGSNFPLSTAFPILIANAVEWLSERGSNTRQIIAGQPLRWNVDAGVRAADIRVTLPSGRTAPVTVNDGRLTFAETNDAGIYRVTGLGPDRLFVVNPDSSETDPVAQAITPASGVAQAFTPASEATLALIAFAIVLLGLELWMFGRQSPIAFVPALRIATATFVLFAALDVKIPAGRGSLDVIFALDRSDSVPLREQRGALERIRQLTQAMKPGDRAGLVVFARDATVESPLDARFGASSISSRVNGTDTNIESGLKTARAVLPRDSHGRLVLLSDGREISGTAVDEAARAASSGVAIDVVAFADTSGYRTRVTHIDAPGEVNAGEPFTVRLDVAGPPNVRDRVVLYRDSERVADAEVTLTRDGASSVAFTEVRRDSGQYSYTAAAISGDDDGRSIGTIVSVTGAPTVLYAGNGDTLRRPLESVGIRVRRTTMDGVPGDVAALASYAAIVLDRLPPSGFSPAQLAAVKTFVEQDGGGLLVLGGATDLATGGVAAGQLAPMLPVDFRPRSGRRDAPIGFVLVFDKSGSMADRAGGIPKIELAREAARKLFEVVPPGDSIGVVAFDSTAKVAIPFGPKRDPRDVVAPLRAIEASGSTAIAPAADIAVDWLRDPRFSSRHILLISDGRTSAADAERLRATLRGAKIQLSVVAIGNDADKPLLQSLAESNGGRALFPDDIRQLPAIVAREAARATGGSTVNEPFEARLSSHSVLAGIDRTHPPRMSGYVVGALKPAASAILSSHLDDPLLAAWQAGLGRVVVFTSDLDSSWTDGLRRWSDFAALWRQTARWLIRSATDRRIVPTIVESSGAARLIVTAEDRDGRALGLRHGDVTTRTPSGDIRVAPLEPTAPGIFETALPATETGTYTVAITARDSAGTDVRVVKGFYWSADREYLSVGSDRATLGRIAAAAGGQILGPGDNPFLMNRPRGWFALRPYLLAAALVGFLFDVATRGRAIWRRRLRRAAVGAGEATA